GQVSWAGSRGRGETASPARGRHRGKPVLAEMSPARTLGWSIRTAVPSLCDVSTARTRVRDHATEHPRCGPAYGLADEFRAPRLTVRRRMEGAGGGANQILQ